MNNLCEDIILIILNKLSVPNLINIIQTCKYLNNIGKQDRMWKERIPKRYLKRYNIKNYKEYYCHKNNKNRFGLHFNDCNKILFSKNKIKSLPNSICIFTNLIELKLNHNILLYVPTQISCLTSLKILTLYHNKFIEFPTSICTLTNLRNLNLGGNMISSIPTQVSNLISLQELNLSYNKLTEFPISICKLFNLKYLYLSHMNINVLSKEINSLTNLYFLEMTHSNLQLIDINLSTLSYLHLYNNELDVIPHISENLRYMDLSYNNISIWSKYQTYNKNCQLVMKDIDEFVNDIKIVILLFLVAVCFYHLLIYI